MCSAVIDLMEEFPCLFETAVDKEAWIIDYLIDGGVEFIGMSFFVVV